MGMKRRHLARLAAAALTLLVACGSPLPPDEDEPHYPAVANADTRVLDATARASLQAYDPDSGALVFAGTDLPALAAGNVVVSEPTPAAPYGILRRVTDVDDSVPGQLTLQTELASLDMALESGSLYESFAMQPDDIANVEYLVDGLRMFDPDEPAERQRLAAAAAEDGLAPLSLPSGFIGWTFDDLVVYDADGNLSTKNDQVLVKGDVGVQPIFDVGFALNCSYLCIKTNPYFKFEVGGQVIARLALDSKTPVGLTLSKAIPLATLTGNTITFSIGPVPVVIVPKLKLELRIDGSVGFSVSYEVQENLTLTAGGQYKNGKWSNISDASHEELAQPVKSPSFVQVVAKAKLKGAIRGELLLYGVVGLYAEIVPQVGLDIAYPRDPIWKLTAGLEANAGITIDVWIFDKDWQASLIDLEWQVAQSDNTAPEVTILTQGPVQVGPNGVNLRATVRDAEDGNACCATTFRSSNPADGASGLLGTATGSAPEVRVTFATTGDRTITVKAVDSGGRETTKTVALAVENTAPELTITAPYNGQTFYAGQLVRFRSFNYDPNEEAYSVPCDQLAWSAGATLGTGCTLTVADGFAEGTRTVTLTATDSHGGVGSAQVTLSIGPAPANYPPRVTITSPTDYSYAPQFEPLTLNYDVVDPEGDDTVSVVWDALVGYDPSTGTGTALYPVVPDDEGKWSVSQLPGFEGNVCEVDTLIRLRVRVTDAQGSVGEDYVVLRFTVIC